MIEKETMKAAVKEVWIRSLTVLQPDVMEALSGALEKERSPRGREYLRIMIENAKRAAERRMVICQDTGVPTFFIRTPLDFPYAESVRDTFDETLRELTYGEFPMRPMVVHPFTREDRGDNTAAQVPVIHAELDNSMEFMEIKAMPKGAGSGIWSALKMLPSTDGVAGVKKFVIDSVLNAGANPCPPILVGVGVGGPMEEVALLATKASVRPLNEIHPDPDAAALEQELMEAINASQIGPMGMGGDTTALAVHVEYAGTHRPWMPVAVNINCWPGRRAVCRIYRDGHVEQI
ncbi:MAG: fumarate hydratase [Lachnospiraceae bacterium]|nr:fumarate hydratase [Lachnospiraceae bacterium]